ncbi:DUF3794 and LysM peptidoglycan-binding domain-containing protein [Desulfitibacter alkalitolerans]|uniref:DUF3794 and LysM peptidoglycan-binding domain-containing protein n=1 Tax=Desulfitibacter alkalitolerans TaxID=264641 RepID=UPI0004888ED7|nr:SPOCS domain-containing protein [Desulfitibacter alkalitolerans]
MPMDLIDVQRRLLKVQNVVGEDTQQVKVLNEIAFPVQIRKIWDTMAEVRDVEINVIKDKVIVEGIIHKQIFYVSDENRIVDGIKYQKGEVFELSVDEPFIAHVDIPGTRPGFHVQVATRIEFIGYDEIKPIQPKPKPHSEGEAMHHPHPKPEPARNLWRQTLILEVFVKVTETVQMEVVVDVVAPELDLEVIKELLKVQSVVGEDENQVSVVRDIEFDRRVKKIRNIQTKIENVTTKIVPDKIIVEGVLHKQIFYVEQNTNKVFEQTVRESFTAFVDVPGARPGHTVQVTVEVEFVDIDLRNGNAHEGFRSGRQTAVLAVFAKVTEELQIDVVVDVIGDVDVFKELLKVESVIAEDSKQVTVKNDVALMRPAKKIAETDATVNINFTETKIINDKVIVVGEVKKQIYYVDLCTGGVFEQGVVEKFTTFVDLPGARPGMNLHITGEVEFVEFAPPKYPEDVCKLFEWSKFDPEKFPWKQTAVVQVFVKVTETLQLDVVTDVVAVEPTPTPTPTPAPTECPPGSTITIYYIQKGDTLFKLAQKYNTTVDAILALNPGIDPKNLQVGQRIKICVFKPLG